MRRAPWTYEVPAAGADSVALEEYVVEEASGVPVGKVMTVLERRGDLYVAVESRKAKSAQKGVPPRMNGRRRPRRERVRSLQ
jgi:hypothetical protein